MEFFLHFLFLHSSVCLAPLDSIHFSSSQLNIGAVSVHHSLPPQSTQLFDAINPRYEYYESYLQRRNGCKSPTPQRLESSWNELIRRNLSCWPGERWWRRRRQRESIATWLHTYILQIGFNYPSNMHNWEYRGF